MTCLCSESVGVYIFAVYFYLVAKIVFQQSRIYFSPVKYIIDLIHGICNSIFRDKTGIYNHHDNQSYTIQMEISIDDQVSGLGYDFPFF